ncbi:MAG: type II toxin-antitoxin system HicB family antitoxin [Candidatus Accumulibacter sp.]|jgi:antitoxin HicB|nr:type II toxin-antitoxin system HicB family antitoxin [Accumulibacter sp.]
MFYPVSLKEDGNGEILVEFPDFPFVHSVGANVEEALREALDALESGIEFCFDERRPVPLPSRVKKGEHALRLPALIVSKVFLRKEMLAQGVKKSDLARRLAIAPPNVERIFRARHKTRLETIESAFSCLGKQLEVNIV